MGTFDTFFLLGIFFILVLINIWVFFFETFGTFLYFLYFFNRCTYLLLWYIFAHLVLFVLVGTFFSLGSIFIPLFRCKFFFNFGYFFESFGTFSILLFWYFIHLGIFLHFLLFLCSSGTFYTIGAFDTFCYIFSPFWYLFFIAFQNCVAIP